MFKKGEKVATAIKMPLKLIFLLYFIALLYDILVAKCMKCRTIQIVYSIVSHLVRSRLLKDERVVVIDTMSSGSRYNTQGRPILPPEVVSTYPTLVVFQEHIWQTTE